MSEVPESEAIAPPILKEEAPITTQAATMTMDQSNESKPMTEFSDDSKTVSEQPSTPQSQTTNLSESTEVSSRGSRAPPPLSTSASLAAAAATGASQPIDQQTVRKPAGLPANASLADRIAALQKSSSIRRTDRSVSSAVTSSSSSQSGANMITGGIGENSSRSVSAGTKIGGSAATGVKDRIAKFQTSEAKPLIPKSSFGSPVPMHNDRNMNALKPYPGANASGSGSGSWGEGVLRPQATGGAWGSGAWQSADSSFSGANANVRPQLTGSAWLGVGGSSPSFGRGKTAGSYSSAGSLSRSPINNKRDAFLDLDEDTTSTTSSSLLAVSSSPQKTKPPMRRDGSFSEAQLAAAQMGLGRTSRAASTDGTESVGGQSMRATASDDASQPKLPTDLAHLPDAPTSEIGMDQSSKEQSLPSLPNAPSSVPIVRPPKNSEISTNDVEIGVANVPAEKLESLRRKVSGAGDGSYADTFLTSPISETSFDSHRGSDGGGISAPVGAAAATGDRAALMQAIQSRRKEKALSLALRSQNSTEEATAEIGRLALNSSDSNDGSVIEKSPSSKIQDLPSRAHVQRTESDRVDPNDPRAHKVMGAGLLVPDDEVLSAERKEKEHDFVATDAGQQIKDQSAPVIPSSDIINGKSTNGFESPVHPSETDSYTVQISNPDSSTTSNLMTKSNSEGFNQAQSAASVAATQAKDAITAARSKSQRVQRPPPGRMMTAAEMDASDDEYEPGWVSVTKVMSSSRQK